eukprot:466198-Prorocentrum_minimum.AAC.39
MPVATLPPLFKFVNDQISIGGGIQISEPPVPVSSGLDFRARNELRVVKESSVTGRGVTVSYDTNLRDRFGTEVYDMTVDPTSPEQDPTGTAFDLRFALTDNFAHVTTPFAHLAAHVTLVREQDMHQFDLHARTHALRVHSHGLVVTDFQPSTLAPVGSAEADNRFNDNRAHRNRSRQFAPTRFAQHYFGAITGVQVFWDVNTDQTVQVYGPNKFAVVLVVVDDFQTHVCMTRSVFVHGVYDVRVSPSRPGGVRNGVNLDDTVRVTWRTSSYDDTMITAMQVRVPTTNEVLLDLIELFAESDRFGTVEFPTSAMQDFRGFFWVYVEYKQVQVSPLNLSNVLTFETSNEPVSIGFKISNEERFNVGYHELYVQLTTLTMSANTNTSDADFDPGFSRTVTLRLFEDEARTRPAGDVVVLRFVDDAHIVGNLDAATAYFVSYETNDNLNPTFLDDIDAQYSTRTDPDAVTDSDGPVIAPIELSKQGSTYVFGTRITDASFIVNVRFSLNADLDMETVTTFQQWTRIDLDELTNEVVVSAQDLFVYYKDATNVKPYLVSQVHNTDYTRLKLIVQATDIHNNRTTRTIVFSVE